MRIGRGPGDAAALDEAADLLATARFPVILAGGVILAGATAEAVRLRTARCARLHSYLHNDAFPASHPLWCGPLGYQGSKAAMKLIAEADVVLALGTRLGPFGTLPQYGMEYWPQRADRAGRRRGMLRLVKPISVGIHGDAKAAAADLASTRRGANSRPAGTAPSSGGGLPRRRPLWEHELGWTHERDPYSLEVAKDSPHMHPRELLRALRTGDAGRRDGLDRSAMIRRCRTRTFVSTGRARCSADELRNAVTRVPGNLRRQEIVPADRPAIAYVSDGAFGISLNRLLTCAREDRRHGGGVQQRPVGPRRRTVDFLICDGSSASTSRVRAGQRWRAFGCDGVTVSRIEDVAPALEAAVRAGRIAAYRPCSR